MTNTAALSARIGKQIYEELGSASAAEFIEFAAARWPGLAAFSTLEDPNPGLKRLAFADLTWTVPKSMFWSHQHRMSTGYHRFILGKYSIPGFCEVEPGDTVLDCGSFIGGFASSCANKARRVIAVEPSPINSLAAEANLARHPNVTLVKCGLWHESGTLNFNISETAIDDGFLEPDHGKPVGTTEVETLTVADLARRHGVERFDFLKIEAEGVELEILRGEGGLDCNRIAVDVAPERGGESPEAEVAALLQDHGFETRKKGIVVFGRR